jgi:hypothetical protein
LRGCTWNALSVRIAIVGSRPSDGAPTMTDDMLNLDSARPDH